jgi:hypothetical protein
MWMTVGVLRFAITLADKLSSSRIGAQLPLALDMAERVRRASGCFGRTIHRAPSRSLTSTAFCFVSALT